jgi:hypothetical protein
MSWHLTIDCALAAMGVYYIVAGLRRDHAGTSALGLFLIVVAIMPWPSP